MTTPNHACAGRQPHCRDTKLLSKLPMAPFAMTNLPDEKPVSDRASEGSDNEGSENGTENAVAPQGLGSMGGIPIDDEVEGELIDRDEDLLNDIEDDATELDLTHMRIRSLSVLNLKRLTKLTYVSFRQNLITSLRGLEDLPEDLEELDVYDNRIDHIGHHLDHFGPKMHTLDLSFNNIRHIKHIDHLTGLKNLFFVQNQISHIQNLDTLTSITNLELGANKIRKIEGLDKLVNLEQLWLGKNKITKLENLGALKKLKILSIQSNRITKLEGLEELEDLEELYISHNGIEKIEGLDNNKKLNTIDITANRISELENLSHLTELEELWASSNQLSSFPNVEKELGKLPKLHTVYFEHNPLQRQNMVTYRNKVKLALGPSLRQIDATFIRT